MEGERPYTAAELQKLVDFAMDEGGNAWKAAHPDNIVLACFFAVYSTGASLHDLCRESLKTRTRVPLEMWRIFGPYGCMDVFLELLNRPQDRYWTIETLRYVGGAEAFSALKREAERGDSCARQAVNAIEREPDKWNYRGPNDLVASPLREPNAMERVIADLVTGRAVPKASIRLVASLLHDHNKRLRRAAQECLVGTSYGADVLYDELLSRSRPLDDELIEVLVSIGDERARDLLLRSTRTEDSRLQGACYKALSKLDLRSSVDVLVELFREDGSQSDYQLAALFRAAGRQGTERLLDLFDRDDEIRRRGGTLLALVAEEAALPPLIDALNSPFREVRASALEGLSALRAVPVLVEQLPKMENVERQRAGLQALALMIGNDLVKAAEPGVLACVHELLSRRATRAEALHVVQTLRSPQSYLLLFDLLESEDASQAKDAIDACESLMAREVEPPPEVVDAVVRRLRQRGPASQPASLRLIVHALHFQGAVELAAIDALASFLQDDELGELTVHILEKDPAAAKKIVAAGVARGEVAERLRKEIARHDERRRADERARADVDRAVMHGIDGPSSLRRQRSTDEFWTPAADRYVIPRPFTTANMSVTSPRSVLPGSQFVLAVWVHSSGDEAVRRHAASLTSGQLRMQTKRSVQVPDSSVLNVKLELPGFTLDEDADTMYWQHGEEAVGNCTFGVTVPRELPQGSYPGKASFWLAGMRVAKLDFLVEVGAKEAGIADMTTDGERPRTAFASYASEERSLVLARIQGMLAVVPDLEVFLDVVSLRSGEHWNDRILQEIADRDLFLLFWSLAASRSKWVQVEWRAALETKGLDGINPVPLQSPAISPPPPELSALNFGDWTLALGP